MNLDVPGSGNKQVSYFRLNPFSRFPSISSSFSRDEIIKQLHQFQPVYFHDSLEMDFCWELMFWEEDNTMQKLGRKQNEAIIERYG